jgi:hypothetical protein
MISLFQDPVRDEWFRFIKRDFLNGRWYLLLREVNNSLPSKKMLFAYGNK